MSVRVCVLQSQILEISYFFNASLGTSLLNVIFNCIFEALKKMEVRGGYGDCFELHYWLCRTTPDAFAKAMFILLLVQFGAFL